jgi:hypothetical protein
MVPQRKVPFSSPRKSLGSRTLQRIRGHLPLLCTSLALAHLVSNSWERSARNLHCHSGKWNGSATETALGLSDGKAPYRRWVLLAQGPVANHECQSEALPVTGLAAGVTGCSPKLVCDGLHSPSPYPTPPWSWKMGHVPL